MTDSKHYLLEESDESTLTDLSSDTSPESHRRYSSASLYGHPDSVAEKALNSTQDKMEGQPLSLSPVEEPMSVDRESLRKNAVRISLTRRIPVKKEMERKELESLVTAAHNDLDKLIHYTLIVVEENNSLKEVLKDAVIFSEDGNLGDYSEILISRDKELPILNSLSHQHFSTRPLLASSHSQPQHSNEATVSPQPAVSSEHTYQSDQMFDLSMDTSSLKSEPTPVFSRSLNEIEGELSTGSEIRFSPFSPQATIAENFTHAVSNQTNLDIENVIRSPRAELSIKKLQLLTQSCREHGNKHNIGGRRSTRGKQKSSKKPKRAKSLQKVAVNYTSSELDEREIMLKKPTFFTSDMLGVIMERNELKEKVHMLEEKVDELGEELAHTQMKLVDELQGETEGIQRTNFFRRNTRIKSKKSESEIFISDVLVIGYKKKERVFVYVIHTTWSDGQRFEIYRRYGEFFTYDDRLLQLFQTEGSKIDKVLPTLPNIDNVLSLFGRTNNEHVIKQRLGTINDYCQILLCELDVMISRNDFVLSFFRPQPGDRQLQNLAKSRTESELGMSIISVYPQQVPAGSTFEEYVTLADYKPKSEGELSVKAGEVVKVINREATGWWMVSQSPECENGEERVGYIPGDFLKRYDPTQNVDEDSIKNYLGFVSPAALTDSARADVDSALKYVAIEDYTSDDPRQLCFTEGTQVIVIEKSEDGWWLVAAGGRHGWAPASYLEPMDRRIYPEGEDLFVSMRIMDVVSGEKYVTKAAFKGEIEEDISFPEKATIEVIEKSISGWWMVRHKGKIGMAPASMLALTESQLNVPGEYKFAMTVDLGHGVSGIIQPPPRSKRFLLLSQSHRRQRSNTNTDEKNFETLFEEGHTPCSSSSNSDNSDIETKHSSMSKHVRKHVITNEKRRRKFKSFLHVRPDDIKSKRSSSMSQQDKRATLPASLMQRSWGAKKLDFKGMEVFIGENSPLEAKKGSFPSKPRSLSNDELLMGSLMNRETQGKGTPSDQPEDFLHHNDKLPFETEAISNPESICGLETKMNEIQCTNGSTKCETQRMLPKPVEENTPSKIALNDLPLSKDLHISPAQQLNVPSEASIESTSGAKTSESINIIENTKTLSSLPMPESEEGERSVSTSVTNCNESSSDL